MRAIRFNPQEFLLAVATSDRTVKLYDIEFMELFCITAPDTCPTRQEYCGSRYVHWGRFVERQTGFVPLVRASV